MPNLAAHRLPPVGSWADAVADSDADLLRRYARERDGPAFAVLVRRHGPLVLGVCLRGVGRREDAEDAFQATFLILAREAERIARPELLANWLFGVAYRVSRKAKRADRRRRARETAATRDSRLAPEAEDWTDVSPVIDEELNRLAEHHRTAVILCDVQGLNRREAAARLGVSEGTLSSRLHAGRKRLADRLTRRGVTLGAVAAGQLAVAHMARAVPEELTTRLGQALQHLFAGHPVPGAVGELIREGVTMRTRVLAGIVVLGLGTGLTVAAWPGDEPPPTQSAAKRPDPPAKDGPADKPPGPGKAKLIDTLEVPNRVRRMEWSADGNQLRLLPASTQSWIVYPFNPQTLAVDVKSSFPVPIGTQSWTQFSRDGRTLYTLEQRGGRIHATNKLIANSIRKDPNPSLSEDWSVNLDPEYGVPAGMSADGKTVYTVQAKPEPRPSNVPTHAGRHYRAKFRAVDAATGDGVRVVADFLDGGETLFTHRLSRDASRLYLGVVADRALRLRCLDTATGKQMWERPLEISFSMFTLDHALLETYDGRTLVLLAGSSQTSARGLRLDAATGEPRSGELRGVELAGLDTRVLSQRMVTIDGRLLAGVVEDRSTGTPQNVLRVWDLSDGTVLKEWACDDPPVVEFAPGGGVLAIAEPVGRAGRDQAPLAVRTILGVWDLRSLVR